MKITFILADITSIGGIERVVSILTDIFVAHGHKVTILSLFRAHETLNYEFNKSITIVYLSKKKYAIKKQGGILRLQMLCSIILRLKRFLKHNECDLIMSHGFPINFITWLSGYAPKTIACEHVFYNYYNTLIKTIRWYIYKRFYKVVVLTENDRKYFQKRIGNVICIPNPIQPSKRTIADLESKRMICVGRLSYQKGYDLLLKILPPIFKSFPDWKLDIYGEGDLKDELLAIRDALGLQSYVSFKGTTSDIFKEYAQSALLVLPSRFEGFAMVLIEAACCGLPIVAFDCPNGSSDILKKDRGLLVGAKDCEGLQKAIIKMVGSLDLRKEYSKRGLEIPDDYAPNKIYQRWNSVFEEYIEHYS